MATDNTRSGLLCSRLLRTSCALVMLCLLIAAVPTPTRPDYDGAYPRYSKQEIQSGHQRGTPRNIVLILPCCALSSRPNLIFASMPSLAKARSA